MVSVILKGIEVNDMNMGVEEKYRELTCQLDDVYFCGDSYKELNDTIKGMNPDTKYVLIASIGVEPTIDWDKDLVETLHTYDDIVAVCPRLVTVENVVVFNGLSEIDPSKEPKDYFYGFNKDIKKIFFSDGDTIEGFTDDCVFIRYEDLVNTMFSDARFDRYCGDFELSQRLSESGKIIITSNPTFILYYSKNFGDFDKEVHKKDIFEFCRDEVYELIEKEDMEIEEEKVEVPNKRGRKKVIK